MCSVSLIRPTPQSLRLGMNRDERDARPTSHEPVRSHAGNLPVLLTVDGRAGGAWIGVNAAGVAACLLNRTVAGDALPASATARSRGALVPRLLEQRSALAANAALTAWTTTDMLGLPPFTLVLADAQTTCSQTWDGRQLNTQPAQAIYTSSGIGDAAVAPARRQAWDRLAGAAPDAERQDAWHRSRIGDVGAAWVLMRRDKAHTVSQCVVEIDPETVTLSEVLLDDHGDQQRRRRLILPRA